MHKKESWYITRLHKNKLKKYHWKRGQLCFYCRRKFLSIKFATIEHIYPKSAGGKLTIGNTTLTCKKCNDLKSSKIIPHNTFLQLVKECGIISK